MDATAKNLLAEVVYETIVNNFNHNLAKKNFKLAQQELGNEEMFSNNELTYEIDNILEEMESVLEDYGR